MTQNLFPIFDRALGRTDKEQLLNQRGIVLWVFGLSSSGKTTISLALERRLHEMGYLVQLLDGDNVRTGINNNLSFSEADRFENIRRIAEVAKIMMNCGVITICSFITPLEQMREMARNIVGSDDFVEVFVDTPIEVCEQRDVKGLYKKARAGEVKHFTGISAPFEGSKNPDFRLDTVSKTPEQLVDDLVKALGSRIRH